MQKHLEMIKKRFEGDDYAKSLGIVLDELTGDSIRMHMQLREDMSDWFGRPHGGVVYSLADAAFSVLGNNTNNLAVALTCSIIFHVSPDWGTIFTVEGETLSVTRRTATYLFNVYMEKEETRTLIATMKGVSYRTGKKIDSNVE